MNYELEINRSRPFLFNALNGDRPSLVSGSGNATLLSTAPTQLAFPIYNESYPNAPFSLEVWFLPIDYNNAGEVVVLGHSTEGILWDGTKFILRLKHKTGEIVEGTWSPAEWQNFHLVMVYDTAKISLFVNGVRRIEEDVVAGATFLAGSGVHVNVHYVPTGTSRGVYDSVAFYIRALTDEEINAHYLLGSEVLDSTAIAMQKGGTTWSLTYQDVDVYESIRYDLSNWNVGLFDRVSVGDTLIADGDGGTWRHVVPLGALAGDNTDGAHISYVGQGVTLAYSINGSTWTTIENGTTVLEDAVATDVILFISLTFEEDGWVESLTIDVLNSRVMNPLRGNRQLTFKSASMDRSQSNQLDYHRNMGAKLRNNGYITILPDIEDDPILTRTVEFWAKKDSGAQTTIFEQNGTNRVRIEADNTIQFTSPALSVKINNVSAVHATTVVPSGWNHYQIVMTTANNHSLRFGSNADGTAAGSMTYYAIALYPNIPTNTYTSNVGAPSLRIDDASAVTLSEDSPAVSIFAYSWSYVSTAR